MHLTTRLSTLLLLFAALLLGCGGGSTAPPPPTYAVTYAANGAGGGTVPVDANRYAQGGTVTVLGNTGGLTRTGYTFASWCVRADGTGSSYTQGQTFTMGGWDTTLYAAWTLNPTYTVTYDANQASSGSVPVDTTHYEVGNTVTVLGNPGTLARAGYTFAGWCLTADGTGSAYAQGQTFVMGSTNVRLFAKWSLNPTFTVTYDANQASSGSVPTDATHYEQGWTVTVLGNTGNLLRTGYTFAGWCLAQDGSGTTYGQGDTFSMGAAPVLLYAKWTLNPTYTVTYDGNGSTGGSVPVDGTHYETGFNVTVLGNTQNLVKVVSAISQVFAGWSTQTDGGGTTYAVGQTFPMGTANVTLFARWLPPYILPTAANDVSLGAGSVLVAGTRAYVVAGGLFKVLDITDPLNPILLGSVSHGFTDLRVEAQAISNNIVWCARSSSGGMGNATYVSGIDVSDPAAPVVAGSLTLQGSSSLLSNVSRVYSGYLLVHDYSRNLVYVIDISNPAVPTLFNQWGVPNMVNGGPGNMLIEGPLLYLPCGEASVFHVYDLTNLASVTLVGSVSTGDQCYGPTVKIGAYVYLTTRSDMKVIDVSNPSSPAVVGSAALTGYLKERNGRLFSFNFNGVGVPPTVRAYSLVDPVVPIVEASSTVAIPPSATSLTLSSLPMPTANWVGTYLVGLTYGSDSATSGVRALDFPVN